MSEDYTQAVGWTREKLWEAYRGRESFGKVWAIGCVAAKEIFEQILEGEAKERWINKGATWPMLVQLVEGSQRIVEEDSKRKVAIKITHEDESSSDNILNDLDLQESHYNTGKLLAR